MSHNMKNQENLSTFGKDSQHTLRWHWCRNYLTKTKKSHCSENVPTGGVHIHETSGKIIHRDGG